MKKLIFTLAIIASASFLMADVVSTDSAVQPMPPDPSQTVQKLQPVENLENVIPGAVDTNNQALMQALNDDPMLKTSPVAQSPNTNDLSGQAEASIVNAGGATFQNIGGQVNNDIVSANNVLASGGTDSGMEEAAEISKEMGLNDVNNLSVPQENISTGQVNQ